MLLNLCYHSVSDENYMYAVTSQEFEKQLVLLTKKFKVISVQELFERIQSNDLKTGNYATITFDDGLRDNFLNAYPVLVKHQIPATIFVRTDCVGRTQVVDSGFEFDTLSWADMKKMVSSGLIEIGSHTHSHKVLSGLEKNVIIKELLNSKVSIREGLGIEPRYFAYPKGKSDEKADLLVAEEFDLAFAFPGVVEDISKIKVYSIPRVIISKNVSILKFYFMRYRIYWKIKQVKDWLRSFVGFPIPKVIR